MFLTRTIQFSAWGFLGNAAEPARPKHEVTETSMRESQRSHILLGWEVVWHTDFSEFLKALREIPPTLFPSVTAVGPQKHLAAVLVRSEEREGDEIFIPFPADSCKLRLSSWYLVTYQNKEEEQKSFCPHGTHGPEPCLVLMLCGDPNGCPVARWPLQESVWLSSTPSTNISFKAASKGFVREGVENYNGTFGENVIFFVHIFFSSSIFLE